MPILPPILRTQIEEAQRHTKSNMEAARWLGVNYKRYKQYAELYGLFERHLNMKGVGTDKGFAARPTSIPLREILDNKHPTYSRRKLKNRLIARGKLKEQCAVCGFDERRITDNRLPLVLSFKDNDPTNMRLENLELLCYNCMFLTTGAPNVAYRRSIEKSFEGKNVKGTEPRMTPADYHDPDDLIPEPDIELTDEEKQELLNEI